VYQGESVENSSFRKDSLMMSKGERERERDFKYNERVYMLRERKKSYTFEQNDLEFRGYKRPPE